MAEFITDPIVVTILLTIAGMAMVLELFSPKLGLSGLVGLSALLIFFYGHFMAGLAGMGTLALFVAGIVLIFLEFFLPGAVAGTLGVAALVGSLFLAGENTFQIGVSLLISIGFSVLFFVLLVKVFHKKMALFNSMVLLDSARKEDGYVSNLNRTDLLGREGTALTILRPAGMAVFNNERVDVVTEGAFVAKNAKVKVMEVEGPRVVVREIKN